MAPLSKYAFSEFVNESQYCCSFYCMNPAGKARRLSEQKQSKRTKFFYTDRYSNHNNCVSMSVFIPITASVDITTDTNSLTASADRKRAILSRAKINIRYQTKNAN